LPVDKKLHFFAEQALRKLNAEFAYAFFCMTSSTTPQKKKKEIYFLFGASNKFFFCMTFFPIHICFFGELIVHL
jgi:hypothetical protein